MSLRALGGRRSFVQMGKIALSAALTRTDGSGKRLLRQLR
jgi:hypothetical protein